MKFILYADTPEELKVELVRWLRDQAARLAARSKTPKLGLRDARDLMERSSECVMAAQFLENLRVLPRAQNPFGDAAQVVDGEAV